MAYVMFFEGCAISWKSKLHTFITLSTNNSEYVASAKCGREAKFIWNLLCSIEKKRYVDPIVLFSDNNGSIALNYDPVFHESTKHVEAADHYTRELVQRGIVDITHVTTDKMIADALTKPLPFTQFIFLIMHFMTNEPVIPQA